jgi:hypothetical protein
MSIAIAEALIRVLESPNESDSNLENANIVDGLFAIARALDRVAFAIEHKNTGSELSPQPGIDRLSESI